MKLLESYSRSCSVDINHKPQLYEKFFPLGHLDKFITIQTKSGMPAKDYSYFQEVVDIIFPVLEKLNIKIIHLGQDSLPLNHTINFNNRTSIGQAYFILKKSLLHVGADSWLCHAACASNIPCVSLYGSTTVINHAPYHFEPNASIFLESSRNNKKASFQREETPKTIDLITPELVARSICKLLNLDLDYPYKTLYIGKSYQNKVIESACDSVINLQALNIPNIICRLDYNFDLNILQQQLSTSKCCILTDKPVPENILRGFRPNILEVIYEVKKDNPATFCKTIQDSQIPYRLFSTLPEDELNSIKFNYVDYNPIISRKLVKPKELESYSPESLFYKSGKVTLGRGKIYQSRWDYHNDRPVKAIFDGPQQLIDINVDSLFWEEEYLLFLTKE